MKQLNEMKLFVTESGQIFTKNGLWLYVWILIFLVITFKLYISGDSVALVDGLDHVIQCFRADSIHYPCGPQVAHFPIFQYLIALPFRLLGLKNDTLLPLLALLNFGWFLVSIAAFWRAGILAAGIRGGHLASIVLFSGYITWYATASFNEAAAFSLFALLALSILDQWKIFWIATIAFLCTITKEIAFPFVFIIIAIAALTRDQELPNLSDLYKWVYTFMLQYLLAIIAIIFGVIVNSVFNLFRFGSIHNMATLDPLFYTPWPYVPEFFFYLLFSPAGGLFFVWGTLCLLVIIGFYFCRHDSNRLWKLSLMTGMIALVNIGLAKWYSPFGWYAWGPRLTLPFLGGAGIILIVLVGGDIVKILSLLIRKKTIFIGIGIYIFLLSTPNIAVRLNEREFFEKMFAPTIIQKDFGFSKFIIQTVSPNLYMEASLEIYNRNILIPITLRIASKNYIIFIVWFVFLMLILKKCAEVHHHDGSAYTLDEQS